MKLLELPDTVAKAYIDFAPDDWDEFDRTVCWLAKNGVPLKRGDALVRVVGKVPKESGKTVNYSVTREKPNYLRGEEFNSEYTVSMPDYLR